MEEFRLEVDLDYDVEGVGEGVDALPVQSIMTREGAGSFPSGHTEFSLEAADLLSGIRRLRGHVTKRPAGVESQLAGRGGQDVDGSGEEDHFESATGRY